MTNLIRYSPTTDMRRLQREMDRVFDAFMGNQDTDDTAIWSPRVDLSENEDAYLIHLDVPGIDKDDLEIDFQDGTLTVRGERKAHHRDEGTKYVRVERSFGHFFRSFTLPRTVDAEAIAASYHEGVLTITVPKAEESKPRRISVN